MAAALERVDDVAEDWRSRSILSRYQFSSDFVRAHVPLDGRASLLYKALPLTRNDVWMDARGELERRRRGCTPL